LLSNIWIFAGIMLRGKPIEGSGVVLITLMVPVVSFSAAPRDAELTRAKAKITVNLSFMTLIHTYLR